MQKRLSALIAVVGVGVALTGCSHHQAAAAREPTEVLVTSVVQRDVPIYREWVAQLNGSVNAQISPKVSGYIIKRNYQEGYFVTKGQILFEIDARPLRASLDQAKATVAGAMANLGNSKLNVARDTPLAKEKAIAQSQLDNDVQTMKANQAALDAALAEQQTAELNLAWTKVRSPIDGIAGVAAAQVGNLVSTSSILTNVSQLDPIRAYFSISESDYLSIAPQLSLIIHGEAGSAVIGATEAQFIQANGLPFASPGRFVLVGREVNNTTGTIQFAMEFQNKGSILRPGGFGRVRIKIGTAKDALLIPQQAVNEVQGEYQVVVLGADDKAEFRSVEVGERTGIDWIVSKGLKSNERVVVEGFQKLRNGMPVTAKPYTAAAPEAAAG
ncbi:MAG TPA: efflux RND transporter periplasmic adaptor subunit [Steroidobacteraceae bacterium]|nr:efflux RND transporter periplasmic adaptor subunit [Steroidobacteraceae bacterium]